MFLLLPSYRFSAAENQVLSEYLGQEPVERACQRNRGEEVTESDTLNQTT